MWGELLLYGLTGFFSFASSVELAFCEEGTGKDLITMFMCGDVMTGRGMDQVLPYPGDPLIHEPYMSSARGYVELAEQANGPIQQPVRYSYIWGS